MKDKIRKVFKPTEKEKYIRYLENFRKNNVPERYNQVKMLDYLLDDDIDHYVSISNRADGKSFNYVHFILKLSMEYDVGFMFLTRTFTQRPAGMKLIQKIIDVFGYDPYKFNFMAGQKYTQLIYDTKTIGIITDLNEATDLKLESNFLMDFPIIIYDEFLALEGDYLIDEWDRLKTIYGSINRGQEVPLIKFPKLFYLGNAVNFSSPILAYLDLFNILENHKINTVKKYGNIVLEMNRNEEANESRNLRAFNEKIDPITMASFKVNNHNIADNNDRLRISKNADYIYIKLYNEYLRIMYNRDTFESMLSVTSYSDYYDFNLLLKDNNKKSIYLNNSFFDEEYNRFYDKGKYLFDNNYSKDFVLYYNEKLSTLRINKIIKTHYNKNTQNNYQDLKEKQFRENYIEQTKKALYRKFFK